MNQYNEYFDYMNKKITMLSEDNKKLSERIELLEEYALTSDFEHDVNGLVIQLFITIISIGTIYFIYVLLKVFFAYVPKYGEKYIDL